MNLRKIIYLSGLMIALSGLVACGGGGDQTIAGGGIGGSGISNGTITGFGSVYVNGVKFESVSAEIIINGNSEGMFDDAELPFVLNEGMVVTVEGEINVDGVSGRADKIHYGRLIKGPVEMVNANTLSVLGQTIFVDSLTRFGRKLGMLANLVAQDIVEASGFIDASGDVHARYIEIISPDDGIAEIKGYISNLTGTGFTIGTLAVSWSDLSALAINDFVEVKGGYQLGQLAASSVERYAGGFGISDADDAEIEGVVVGNCNMAPCLFSLNGQSVQVTANTEFDGGQVVEIQNGIRLEVEGELVGGVVIAEEVAFKDQIELQSQISSVDPVKRTLELSGMDGLLVQTNDVLTEFEGAVFDDLQVNDNVSIRGRVITGGQNVVFVTKLSFEDMSNDLKLQGPLEARIGDIVTVLGVNIDTSLFIDSDFKIDNQIVGRTTFFNLLQEGDALEIEGGLESGIEWQSVEIDE